MEEFYDPSKYYGIGQIFKLYSGFPLELPCPVSIQHGWKISSTQFDARDEAAENWYWSHGIEQAHKQDFNSVATRTVGAPFLYALRNINYKPLPESERKGSIVFPAHSSANISVSFDFGAYGDLLANLPDQYKPITICMYYLDREKNYDQPFIDRGFEIVDNGDKNSPEFIYKFIQNSQEKRYAFSNQMTSALLFASAMGLKSFFYGPTFTTDSRDENYRGIDYNEYQREWEKRYCDFFRFPNADQEKQKAIVDQELGSDHVYPPHQIHRLLWKCAKDPKYVGALVKQSHDSLFSDLPIPQGYRAFLLFLKLTGMIRKPMKKLDSRQ